MAQLDFGVPQSWDLSPFTPFRSMYVSDDNLFKGLPTNTHRHAKKSQNMGVFLINVVIPWRSQTPLSSVIIIGKCLHYISF